MKLMNIIIEHFIPAENGTNKYKTTKNILK